MNKDDDDNDKSFWRKEYIANNHFVLSWYERSEHTAV